MTILKYELRGLDGIVLDNEDMYVELNDQYISRIQIKDDFRTFEVVLNENVLYCNNQEQVDNKIKSFFLNILLKIKGHIQCPEIIRTKIIGENDDKWGENLLYIKNEPADTRIRLRADEVYTTITTADNFIKYANAEWQFVYAMLQNKNLVVTFMSLYDYLKEKIYQIFFPSEARSTQKQVTTYFRNYKNDYGTDLNFLVDNQGKNVDYLTFLRNEIAHATIKSDLEEYRNLGEKIDSGIIRLTLQSINNVIMEQFLR